MPQMPWQKPKPHIYYRGGFWWCEHVAGLTPDDAWKRWDSFICKNIIFKLSIAA